MNNPVPPTVRPKVRCAPSPGVARAKALYLRTLKRRLEEGSYLTPRRVDTALARLLEAVREDLPDERA